MKKMRFLGSNYAFEIKKNVVDNMFCLSVRHLPSNKSERFYFREFGRAYNAMCSRNKSIPKEI